MHHIPNDAPRPVMAALTELQSEGLVRSWIGDQGELRWALTELGKTFTGLAAEQKELSPPDRGIGQDPVDQDPVSKCDDASGTICQAPSVLPEDQ